MGIYLTYIQEHLLAIVSIVLTIILGYHYLIERDRGIKLSKRYRNSIFEIQSKIFLNATQYLISGNKDLAIREFLNAVDVNRETIETYFALGGLFRSNGEIEKAISIHRSIIARQNISESTRLRALKELALDFDRGGFLDLAIETYKDVLRINRDQSEVISSLCRIFEDVGDWDQAYQYRLMLSKVSNENQSETISHIIVEKAKEHFKKNDLKRCSEELQEAFRFAPSVSAKILELQIVLLENNSEKAKFLLLELLNENPMFTSFVFISLKEGSLSSNEIYSKAVTKLIDYFLEINDNELLNSPSVILAKVRLLKDRNLLNEAYLVLKHGMETLKEVTEILKVEYIGLMIELQKFEEVALQTKQFFKTYNAGHTKHFCKTCGYNSDDIFWRCPQCYQWETIQFRWKV